MQTRPPPQQLALDASLEDALVLAEAREIYRRSVVLGRRYSSFERLMSVPVMARCMRMAAAQRLRLRSQGTRGR